MNDYSTDNHEMLTYQTSRLQSLIKEVQQCCEDRKLYESSRFGLPYSEIKCLLIFNGERYLTVKNMAERLEVAKSRVTKLINDLALKKLVEKISDPKDSRVKLISLTPMGRKISNEVNSFQNDIHMKILSQMNEEERKAVISKLELLRTSMEAVKAQMI
jgi:DNA-binding MarR family transcriptional regulator